VATTTGAASGKQKKDAKKSSAGAAASGDDAEKTKTKKKKFDESGAVPQDQPYQVFVERARRVQVMRSKQRKKALGGRSSTDAAQPHEMLGSTAGRVKAASRQAGGGGGGGGGGHGVESPSSSSEEDEETKGDTGREPVLLLTPTTTTQKKNKIRTTTTTQPLPESINSSSSSSSSTAKAAAETDAAEGNNGEKEQDGHRVARASSSSANAAQTKKKLALPDKKKKKRKEFVKPGESFKNALGLGPDPPNSNWISLERRSFKKGKEVVKSAGEVLVSIELLPKRLAVSDSYANGTGRSSPNLHPALPPPVNRFDPTKALSPYYMLTKMFGSQLIAEFGLVIAIAGIGAGVVVLGPTLMGLFEVANSTAPVGWYVLLGIVFVATLVICLVRYKCVRVAALDPCPCCNVCVPMDCCLPSDDEESDEDDEEDDEAATPEAPPRSPAPELQEVDGDGDGEEGSDEDSGKALLTRREAD